MSSSSPPILPISNQTPTPTLTTHPTPTPIPYPTPPTPLRTLITTLTTTVQTNLATLRPWSDLLPLSKPTSISDASTRIRKNYTYFRTNYLTIITSILALSLITNPFSLLLLASLLAAWLFLYLFRTHNDPPLTVFGREMTSTETLVGLIGLSVVVVFLTSVGSVLMSALMIGVAVVCGHAAFRMPEELFVDEQGEESATGFLSFVGGSNTVVSTVVSARA